ncbi:FUSC family protein [Planotetraspora sp. A-T 1434]|uniref:FUSC family protein n=1 Tax=Planotetraspora sp. A-T 1434 TaxID=2979219 RepID=UPI0021C03592|nr:FUSC family protein [Planotetraspora sp. A-T 1434]MCT9932498.1 FUSC family protein [Planotetraspora sp. A-T 1434]
MRIDDTRLVLGFGLTGAACLVIPLVVGVVTGHPAGGAIVGLGAWLVAARAIADPAGVSTPYMLGGVVSVGVGTFLGVLLSGHNWLMVLVASLVGALGVFVRPVGITPALALLLTASNPLPVDPVRHTGLQLLGGLLSTAMLTAPWPWRRTRPLAATLEEAAHALAALAEAAPSADPHQWDELRRKAAAALRKARTTRMSWQQRSRAAEKTAAALRRVFYEIVALRGLCTALRRQAPDAEEKVGLQELADSIAHALRSFMANCSPVPGVDFTARVDDFRAERPHEERELLVVVLLRQIAHSADRIREALSGAWDAAREMCAPGFTLPALPARPRLSFDDPQVRHALRVFLGTAFASLIIVFYRPAFPHWLVIAVLVTLQPTYGETRARVWARVGGSTVGAIISAGILTFAPGHWVLVPLIGLAAALAFGLSSVHHAYWATFMTMCVLLLIDFQVPQTAKVAESRVVLTILGGLIALACTRLLWPRGETVRLADRVARMLAAHAAATRTLGQVSRGKAAAEKGVDQIGKAALAADVVTGSLGYVAHEPGGSAPRAIEEAVEAAQRVRDDLMTLTSVLHEEPGEGGPVPEVLDMVADRLEAAAEAVQTGEPHEFTGDVDERLADVSASLGGLAERRLAELDEDPKDTRTEVRRALLRTTAVDQALRSLRDDAARLCEAATS